MRQAGVKQKLTNKGLQSPRMKLSERVVFEPVLATPQYAITEEIAQENLTVPGLQLGIRTEASEKVVTSRSTEVENPKKKISKMKRYKKQAPNKKAQLSATNKSGCRSPPSLLISSCYATKQQACTTPFSQKQPSETKSYTSLQYAGSGDASLMRTSTELGLSRVDKSRGIYDPNGLQMIKESLGYRKKSFNGKKSVTMSQRQLAPFKTASKVLYEDFQAAKKEIGVEKADKSKTAMVATIARNNSQNNQMRLKAQTTMADQKTLQRGTTDNRNPQREIKKAPTTNYQPSSPKFAQQQPALANSSSCSALEKLGQSQNQSAANGSRYGGEGVSYSQLENATSAAEMNAHQVSQGVSSWQPGSMEQQANRLAQEGYYQSQKIAKMSNTRSKLNDKNVKSNGQRAVKTSFDLQQFQHHGLVKETLNSHRSNGRATPSMPQQTLGNLSAVPRQITDTGRALSKGLAQQQTPGKLNTNQSSFNDKNPYQPTKKVEAKIHRQQSSHQTPSMKSKYLNHNHQEAQHSSAQKSQYSNMGLKQNIFEAPLKNGSNMGPHRGLRDGDTDGAARMPFELANTFISQDSVQAKVPDTRGQTETLAQKMNHMLTSQNDLARKSILGNHSAQDNGSMTGRSQDVHQKPNIDQRDCSGAIKTHQRISAKIPAKIMPSDSHKSKKQQTWHVMETVKVEQRGFPKEQSRRDFESNEVSGHASRVRSNQPINSLPKRAAGSNFMERSDPMTKGFSQSGVNQHLAKNSRHDVDSVPINVEMQASKGKLQQKRFSSNTHGPHLVQRSNMPLANKYPISSANGLNQKEPNKFPNSNQRDNQVIYNGSQGGTRSTISNRFMRPTKEQAHNADYWKKQAEMPIEQDVQVSHPLLSKRQQGINKRPSMQMPYAMAAQTESCNDSFVILQQNENQTEPKERSDSYFGRFQKMLGFNKSMANGSGGGSSEQVQLNEVRREIMSEHHMMSPQIKPQNVVPKLTLKESNSVDDIQPVSSQKFESPMAKKQLSSHRFKCACEPSSEPYACSSAYRWLTMANNGRQFEIQKSRKAYLDLLGVKDFISMAEERQIECDITRTFPHQQIFQEAQGEGQQALQRVLQAFSKYDSSIGYVQGMNFIVGALLLHCSEEITFWLFVSLIEDYEMRDIYMEGLPGHIKHSTLITQLMEGHLEELYEHLQDIGMNIEIFATDWYFTLFAKVIPTHQMKAFFDNFFQFGWCFFHKFTLTLLRVLAPQILQMDDMQEIKTLLLLPRHKQNFYGDGSPLVDGDEETKSDSSTTGPFSGNYDNLSQQAASSTQPQQRTFFSSIGNFFWPLRHSGSSSMADAQLQELIGDGSIEDLLRKEDAWVQIIELSRNLWGKRLTDGMIKQFLNDYEELQEQQKVAQLEEEAKFHDSQGSNNQAEDGSVDVNLNLVQDYSLTAKKQQNSSNLAHKKKPSDSPLPQGASFSSNELDDDNFENPSNEISPMKKVNDSGMRMPKQTKLMFKNMDSMRQFPQKTPRIDSNRQGSGAQMDAEEMIHEQFSKSHGLSSISIKNNQLLLNQKREPGDSIEPFTNQVRWFNPEQNKHMAEKAIISPKEEPNQEIQQLRTLQQHQAKLAKQQILILEQKRRTIQPDRYKDSSPNEDSF